MRWKVNSNNTGHICRELFQTPVKSHNNIVQSNMLLYYLKQNINQEFEIAIDIPYLTHTNKLCQDLGNACPVYEIAILIKLKCLSWVSLYCDSMASPGVPNHLCQLNIAKQPGNHFITDTL